MDIYTLNRAKTIQEELEELRSDKDIWEGATSFVLEQKFGMEIIDM